MPGRILVAFGAKLRLYSFWGIERLFAELLKILEKRSSPSQILSAGVAKGTGDGPGPNC